MSGMFALESTREDSTSLFGFHDNTANLGLNTTVSYDHRFANNLYAHLTYSFSRSRN